MKRVIILAAVALGMGISTAHAQTEQERQEMEQRLRELRQELRELERKLGRNAFVRIQGGQPLFMEAGQRPRLGVVVQTGRHPVTDSIGALLQAVTPDGPAHKAGLRAGDIVLRFKGEALANARPDPGQRLIDMARDLEENKGVEVVYRRDGRRQTATVTPEVMDGFSYSYVVPDVPTLRLELDTMLENARGAIARARPFMQTMPEFEGAVWGLSSRWSDMELVELSPELGRYFGATEGLLVIRPPRDGLLQLQAGDVIVRIGGRVPQSPSHAARILRSYEPGDELRVEILRDKQRRNLNATVPARERGLLLEGRM